VRGDTIAAVATVSGRGALAVVRVSGPGAETISRRIAAPWPSAPRLATRCRIHAVDNPNALLDDGLITVFPAPHSFTGETVVEFGTHGGNFVPAAVLVALIEAGARNAEPGEFTERAVRNGKLDLIRAEAIADLIDARSRAMHRMAIHQLSGALSRRLDALRDAAIQVEALLAFDIDFPEEDDGRLPRERIAQAADRLVAGLDELLATVPAAILAREGAVVVLAGAPNAGKSSLLNALVGEARVIVSEIPGTTRDAVEVVLEHDPWPLRLIDTAGLRDGAEAVEQLGIEVSVRYLASAHAVIACAETVGGLAAARALIAMHTPAPVIGALTKTDLLSNREQIDCVPADTVAVSAVNGAGLRDLLAAVTSAVQTTLEPQDAGVPMVTRARHRAALAAAREELRSFSAAWRDRHLPAPVAAVHVRTAIHALDELIGAVDVEDVFARVFSTFCVGK
jgi:tRNA modification GTPase